MSVVADVINQALERETWARERLAAHAGRSVRFVAGPGRADFGIDDGGRLRDGSATPDLTLTVSPLRLPALLARPGRWPELVTAAGDPALAETLADLALTFPLFVEQAFARALGPVIGGRVAAAGRELLALPEYAAQRVGDSVARYVGEEADVVLGGSEGRAFASDVGALAAAIDVLEARLDKLSAAASNPR